MKTIHLLSALIITMIFLFPACASDQDQPALNVVVSPDLNIPASHHINGFAVGVQSFTFNRFSAFEAIEKTAEAGGKIIEIFPGQRLKPGDDTPTNQLSDEQIAELHEKLREHDILLVNYGVVVMPTPEEARSVFEYAQKLGVPAITANPNTQQEMDFLEELVKEFDIMMAIHNHPRPEDPESEYRIWDPVHVMNLLEGRDERMGICADTGHWIRSGISPVEALQLSEGRVISLHMKDVDRNSRDAEDVIFGTGVGQISEILAELTRQNFAGHISIEHEANWENNVPDVAQNILYIRNWDEN
ncbi:MAG: sugar phosphate isomerase/epimerase [Balneolaceae bacterium]|nr:MAG: sugar phosphate isomerase/epimerase [Balneolaceae bacterium]